MTSKEMKRLYVTAIYNACERVSYDIGAVTGKDLSISEIDALTAALEVSLAKVHAAKAVTLAKHPDIAQ